MVLFDVPHLCLLEFYRTQCQVTSLATMFFARSFACCWLLAALNSSRISRVVCHGCSMPHAHFLALGRWACSVLGDRYRTHIKLGVWSKVWSAISPSFISLPSHGEPGWHAAGKGCRDPQLSSRALRKSRTSIANAPQSRWGSDPTKRFFWFWETVLEFRPISFLSAYFSVLGPWCATSSLEDVVTKAAPTSWSSWTHRVQAI